MGNTLKIRESETLEFMASFNDEVIISLVASANAKGGSVYVGMGDRGDVKGVDLNNETIAHWINSKKQGNCRIL